MMMSDKHTVFEHTVKIVAHRPTTYKDSDSDSDSGTGFGSDSDSGFPGFV